MYLSIFSKEFIKRSLFEFKRQFEQNEIYQAFCLNLKKTPNNVKELDDIPFLPIEFFKTQRIYISEKTPELEFKSSGTTNSAKRSIHYIDSEQHYQDALKYCFVDFFGETNQPLSLFALLPGYVENQNSSLIYMLEQLNALGLVNLKGYYLRNHKELIKDIEKAKHNNEKILLWGVTFGLLDFVENNKIDLKNHIVLETGGMKGRRKELTRSEVHSILEKSFNVPKVYSEYGMTELLSQSYSAGDGLFKMNENFGVLVRDVYDPLAILPVTKSGVLNIIDLNNTHSCSFIATQDLGRVYANGVFEVLGRTDSSDVRGCNLMAV